MKKTINCDMEIVMLGTGGAMATKCYNTCFTLRNGNDHFLVDAGGGNGILRQLSDAGIDITAIRAMFITHAHTDHLLGAVWVVRAIIASMRKGRYKEPFHIYSHDKVLKTLITILNLTLPQNYLNALGKTIFFDELGNGDVFTSFGMKFTAFDLKSTKEKQFGFKAVLPDGRQMVCLGDEPYNPQCAEYVGSPDWLLCEAFCLYKNIDKFDPYEKSHSTVLDASKAAQNIGAKNLVLYHTEDTCLTSRKAEYTAEAAQHFKGKIYVPDDLERIKL